MDLQEFAKIQPKPVQMWDENDLLIWLKFIELTSLFAVFQKFGISSKGLLSLNENELYNRMGIKSKIIIKKILNWIQNGLPQFDSIIFNQTNSPINEHSQSLSIFKKTKITHRDEETGDEHPLVQPKQQTQEFSIPQKLNKNDRSATAEKRSMKPSVQLTIEEVNNKSLACYEFGEKGGTMGRHSSNNVLIIDNSVAYYHCEIAYEGKQYKLRNLEVIHGTWKKIDSKIVLPKVKIHSQLKKSRIQMGNNYYLVTIDRQTITIKIDKGENKGDQFSFHPQSKHQISIGRKIQCSISFPLDGTLSGIHGKFNFEKDVWYFEDMKTTNGSWLMIDGCELISEGLIFKLGQSTVHYKCRLQDKNKIRSKSVHQNSKMELCASKQVCIQCKEEKNAYFWPCCHLVCCYSCSILFTNCPACKIQISKVVKIFRV